MPFSSLRQYLKGPRSARRRRWGWNPSGGSGLETLEIRIVPATTRLSSLVAAAAALPATSTSLGASSLFPAANQPVTLTASVSQGTSGVPSPTGSVAFFNNGVLAATVPLKNGKATLNLAAPSLGSHLIVATYLGDANNAPSTSAPSALRVGSSNELLMNQVYNIVLRRPIDAASLQHYDLLFAQGVPRRSIVASVVNSPEALQASVQTAYQAYVGRAATSAEVAATLAVSGPSGQRVRAAVLSSPAFVQAKTDGTAAGYVNALALATIGTPFPAAQQARLTAMVEHGTPKFRVALQVVSSVQGQEAFVGQVYQTLLGRAPTTQELRRYAGRPGQLNDARLFTDILSSDEYYTDATGNSLVAATTLTASPNPAASGRSVTLTAKVTSVSGGPIPPTGFVAFFSGSTLLGTGQLNANGIATVNTTTLAAGTNRIIALYEGDTNYAANASNTVTERIVKANASTTTLTAAPTSAVFGQSVKLTATVSAGTGATGTPTGTVQFLNGTTVLGTATVDSNGVATLTTSALPVGTNSVTASYQGDLNFNASTSTAVVESVSKASTTTALSTSPNPAASGKGVTLTANVGAAAPGSGTPTGTVTFFNGTTVVGTATLNSSGVASLVVTNLPVGSNAIKAQYQGDGNFNASTSLAVNQSITGTAATVTTMSATPSSAVSGESVSLKAHVAHGTGGTGTPTGSVKFFRGTILIGSGVLDANGDATLTTTTLPVGSLPITAQYQGDNTFAPSSSTVTVVTVAQASSSTALTASPNPLPSGQMLTLTATVTAVAPGSGTATGNVQFFNGATLLGTATLNGSGVATLQTTQVPVGTLSLTAHYEGNTNFKVSTSPVVHVTVNPTIATKTTVAASPTSAVFGQPVTLTATVTHTTGSQTPTGSVQFFSGTILLGSGTVNGSGKAALTTSALPFGTDAITAKYSGDTNYSPSTSAATNVTVAQASTTTAVTGTPNPSSSGQLVTLTATVTTTSPGTGTPTGTVTFFNGSVVLGSGTLNSSGVATLSTSTLPVGLNTITAKFLGSTNFKASTSPVFTQTVNSTFATATTLSATPTSSVFSQPVTLTATVTHTSGTQTPTGSVQFFNGSTLLGTGTLSSSGVATLSTAALPVGTDSVTAKYMGDNNYATSTSTASSVTVSQASTNTLLTATPNPASVNQTVTLTATVSPVSPAGQTPDGSVEFFSNSLLLGTVAVNSSGVATFTTSWSQTGTNALAAQYQGNTNFVGSTSPTVNETVQ